MTDPAPAARRIFFPAIDALRALAALMVLGYHVIAHGKWDAFPQHGPWLVFRLGWIGVDLFLVISGFVVTHAALGLLDKREPGQFRRDFADRRLRRIVPLYLLTLAVYLFVAEPSLLTGNAHLLIWNVVTHLGFVHNWFRDTHGGIDGPNWSVALEMQFYLLMLLLAPTLRRWRPWAVLLGGMAIAMAWRTLVVLRASGIEAEGWLLQIRISQLPGTLDEFAVGIALALSLHQKPVWWRAWLAPRWRNFAVLVLLAVLAQWLAWAAFWPRGTYWHSPGMVMFWRSLIGLALGALLLVAIAAPPSLVRVLTPIRYLGTISYGIYLWHLPVLLTMLRAGFREWSLLATTLAGTLVLAALSWHGFEKRWLVRAARDRPTGLDPGTPPTATPTG